VEPGSWPETVEPVSDDYRGVAFLGPLG
jgi:hypothetical protein